MTLSWPIVWPGLQCICKIQWVIAKQAGIVCSPSPSLVISVTNVPAADSTAHLWRIRCWEFTMCMITHFLLRVLFPLSGSLERWHPGMLVWGCFSPRGQCSLCLPFHKTKHPYILNLPPSQWYIYWVIAIYSALRGSQRKKKAPRTKENKTIRNIITEWMLSTKCARGDSCAKKGKTKEQ